MTRARIWSAACVLLLCGVGTGAGAAQAQTAKAAVAFKLTLTQTSSPRSPEDPDTNFVTMRITNKDLIEAAQLAHPGAQIQIVTLRDLTGPVPAFVHETVAVLADGMAVQDVFASAPLDGLVPIGSGTLELKNNDVVSLNGTICGGATLTFPTSGNLVATVFGLEEQRGKKGSSPSLLFTTRKEKLTGTATIGDLSVPLLGLVGGTISANAERIVP